jgi:hypothetical protein
LADKLPVADRVKKELNRLRRIFKDIPKGQKDTVQSLIRNAAFMSVTLDDLQEKINANGVTDKYQNGENQWGVKKSPEVEVYNSMIKNHSAVCKQLLDLLPDGDHGKKAADELAAFLAGGKK